MNKLLARTYMLVILGPLFVLAWVIRHLEDWRRGETA